MGQRLRLENRFIVAENDGIVLYDEETRQELVRVRVSQNEDKIDVENRVESLKKAYTAMIQKIRLDKVADIAYEVLIERIDEVDEMLERGGYRYP